MKKSPLPSCSFLTSLLPFKSLKDIVVDCLMPPPNIQVLIPRTCESPFTLYGKVGLADVIKVRVLRWEIIQVGLKCNHSYLSKIELEVDLTYTQRK